MRTDARLNLPGRIGDPNRELKSDGRADPRLVAALAQFGMDGNMPDGGLRDTSPHGEKLAFVAGSEPGFEGLLEALFADVAQVPDVERSTEVIDGQDGNQIHLYIHRPQNQSGDVPCLIHLHGGGMVVLSAENISYRHWRDMLCATGMVVVGVEFRNAAGALGVHPYPAGLNDCMASLEWVNQNKRKLGVDKVVISGESGGGNLCLALTLRAKLENKLDLIQGTYALCPYIYGDYGNKSIDLPSQFENDGYFIEAQSTGVLSSLYNPGTRPEDNFLAWPYWARPDDLVGLPPHAISVNELDMLRDEGLAYYRKLLSAGVSVYSRTVNGVTHCGEMILVKSIPEVTEATVRDIRAFASRV